MPITPSRKAALTLGALAVLAGGAAWWWHAPGDAEPGAILRDGEIGFVLTDISYALAPDAATAGTCPSGMTRNLAEVFAETPGGAQRPGESDGDYSERIDAGARALGNAPDGRNYCQYPEIAPRDVHFRTLSANAAVPGLNLDGESGADNQFARAVGCIHSYQTGGSARQFGSAMATGEWGLLIRLSDVDDLANDDDVSVGIYANADPMQLSPSRETLRFATYAMDQDPRYRTETTGRIVDGVLTTDPVDLRFRSVVNSMHLERVLRDARIRAELGADGSLDGLLAGFAPVRDLYDNQYGFRNGKDGAGEPAAEGLRLGSANGAARVLGYTCHGIYQALNRLADAQPDPETGRNTAISLQYRFSAVNAFLVDVETGSANDALVKGAGPQS